MTKPWMFWGPQKMFEITNMVPNYKHYKLFEMLMIGGSQSLLFCKPQVAYLPMFE